MRKIPTQEERTSYYQEQYYSPGSAARFGGRIIELSIGALRRFRASEIARFAPPGGTVLDVGCGNGILLQSLKERGFQVMGTQLSRPAADSVVQRFGIQVLLGELEELDLPPENFDLVVILHVLEHTPDPAACLGEACRLLKPGGILFLEVPNAGCPTAERFGWDWIHWDPPRHLFHFRRGSLFRLLESLGFSIHETATFSFEYGPYGVVQAWLNRVFPGERHFLFRRLTERPMRLSARLFTHVLFAGLFSPFALVKCVWDSIRGNGEVIRVAARKKPQ